MPRFLIPTLLLFCLCCKPAPESASNTDTLAVDSTDQQDVSDVDMSDDVLQHAAVRFNINYDADYTFEPFKKVRKAAGALYPFQDAYEALSKKDSASMDSTEIIANELILQYNALMKSGTKVPKQNGRENIGTPGEGDESFGLLRESSSKLLDNADFTFVGAAPFIGQDPETYKDASGNPETRYHTDFPENAAFFLNYVYSRNPGPVELTYGPPIRLNHEGGALQVKGIGSIKHNFVNRIPVWFLTWEGAVPGYVLSVELKLAEGYGCDTNLPMLEFGCSKNIDPNSIVGIFVTKDPIPFEKGNMLPQVNGDLWEYDLDGDGQADIAGVISAQTSEVMGDQIMIAIWYVRINGKWEVMDYAAQPECT